MENANGVIKKLTSAERSYYTAAEVREMMGVSRDTAYRMRLTQADLARATGIRPNTINELYHELADRVNLEHLDLICEALDCELDELIVRVPNKESAITHTRQGTQKPGRKR